MSSAETIRELIVSPLAEAGFELWDVEMVKSVVRVFVDRDGGADLDAIARAATLLSTLLDEHPDAAPVEAYELEVSSPGIERTLRTAAQYRRYVGSLVTVKTNVALDGQRRWRGRLASVDDDGFTLAPDGAEDGQTVAFGYGQVDRARTVLVWGPEARPARGGSKQAGGSPRRSDPRGKGATRSGARTGADVKETS